MKTLKKWMQTMALLLFITRSENLEDRYFRHIKDGCFLKREALSCLKYKALKITTKTLFGEKDNSNNTIQINHILSFVPLDPETLNKTLSLIQSNSIKEETRSILSEWAELTKYILKLVQDFFKLKGLKIELPEDARTVEEEDSKDNDDARGRKKKLAVIIPLLTLLATFKTKMLLIPVLLAVLLIKKLLLVAAFLLPSVLSTLKHCKQPHPMSHYSYFGSDTSDYNSDYANSYSYSSGGGYGKDWASNRAYGMPKYRPSTSSYITAPGSVS